MTIDGDKYTLTKNSGVGNISSLKIILGADKTLDAKFAAQVTTSGNVTVNGVAYSSTNELTIATNETNSTLYSGTITITTSREGVTLSGDSNGVTITATNGAITSITGLDAGGTVTYDGKNYARTTNNFIVDGTDYYGVDDNTNVLALSTSSLFKINGIKSSENITITSTKVTIPQ